jgi:carbon-monoxide dehydrogenase medium subunit
MDFLSGKTPSRENIETAAALISENTDCLSDRYASAEYRANLLKTEIMRALASLLASTPW